MDKNDLDDNKHYLEEFEEGAKLTRDEYEKVEERVNFVVVYFTLDDYDLLASYGIYSVSQLPLILMS